MGGPIFSIGGNSRIGQSRVDVLHYLPEGRSNFPSSPQLHVTSPYITTL